MNTSSSTPIAIRAHQELRFPWKVIEVWMMLMIISPRNVPATWPTPPLTAALRA